MNLKPYGKPLLLAALTAALLSGCVGALVGGAAVGTKSAVDRRTTGAQADDNVMALRVEKTALSYLRQNNQTAGYQPSLNVVSYNRQLLLLGQVADEGEKQFVERIARSEQAAEGVYNYVTVASPSRTLTNITADTWGTSKVRAVLLGLSPSVQARVKIVTYDNVTYVMGILTPEEQALVTEKVSTTLGVQKVVTLYQNYQPQA